MPVRMPFLLAFVVCLIGIGCGGDDDIVGAAGSGGSGGVSGAGGAGGRNGGTSGGGGARDDAGDASIEVSGEASADVSSSERVTDQGEASSPMDSQAEAQDESLSDMPDSLTRDSEVDQAPPRDADAAATRPKVCAEHCAQDVDCARDTGIQTFRCHPTTNRCATCVDDLTCIASRSLWIAKTCTSDGACVNEGSVAFGDVCIDVEATGYCAFFASNTTSCMSVLNTTTFSTFTVKKFGSTEMVDVCGKPARCDADRGSCQNPCTSNTSCTPARGGKTCNTGLGRCECASDADCGPGAPTCNLTIKQCECGSHADCSVDTGRTLTCE